MIFALESAANMAQLPTYYFSTLEKAQAKAAIMTLCMGNLTYKTKANIRWNKCTHSEAWCASTRGINFYISIVKVDA